jgi:hypothetical protein
MLSESLFRFRNKGGDLLALKWQIVSSIIGTVGGILGAWALLRTVWRERSRLNVKQKPDKGYSSYKPQSPGKGRLTVTLVIANLSSRPNSVMRFEATLRMSNGASEKLTVEQAKAFSIGLQRGSTNMTTREYCVTPVNVSPHSTAESVLKFENIEESKYQEPFVITITATDMYGKRFSGTAVIDAT